MVRKGDGTLRPAVYADYVASNVAKQSNGLSNQLIAATKPRTATKLPGYR